jgi:hypothetical protein
LENEQQSSKLPINSPNNQKSHKIRVLTATVFLSKIQTTQLSTERRL